MTEKTTYTLKGITQDQSMCMCCGKTNLKRTVALENNTTGQIVYFGTTCAAKALRSAGQSVSKSAIDDDHKVLSAVYNWLDKGYTREQCRDGVWNKFGYMCEVRNNILRITGQVVYEV